jgi:hypothetical protein
MRNHRLPATRNIACNDRAARRHPFQYRLRQTFAV